MTSPDSAMARDLRRQRGPWRFAVMALAALLGLLASEAFLNLTVGRTLAMDLWFTGRVHEPDPTLGFAFTRNYRGLMRHPDGLFAEPLELDARGLRHPATSGMGGHEDVAFVGGASMMFSYGVRDAQAIHSRVAQFSKRPLRTWNAAWPGFDPPMGWKLWRERLGKELEPDLIVLSLYNPRRLARVPDPNAGPPFASSELFRFGVDTAVQPRGRLAFGLGALTYRSILGFKALRALDAAFPAEEGNWPIRAPLVSLSEYLEWVDRQTNTPLLVAFLPNPQSPRPGSYDQARAQVPKHIPVVDVNRVIRTQLRGRRLETLAYGHYAPAATERVGRILARAIDARLEAIAEP